MDVSVIIVNYNTSEMVIECIESIHRFTHCTDYEIIIVDNGSLEGQLSILKGQKDITLVELSENVGFGRANNAGANLAKGQFLFFLNPDTVLAGEAIDKLFSYMHKNPEAGICGGNLYSEDGSPAHSYHMLYPSILSELDFASGKIFRRICFENNYQFNHTKKPLNVAMITGADLMISKRIWDEVNGFDPAFFMYCEDADLCRRVRQKGYMIICLPVAKIIHREGRSFKDDEVRCNRILDGRFVYFHKHYSKIYNLFADTLNVTSIFIAKVLSRILCNGNAYQNLSIRLRTYKKKIREYNGHIY